jgi:hypothetical protein
MLRWGMVFLLLATVAACEGLADVTEIPASQDVYISMGENRVSVYNQTDFLLCAVDVPVGNDSGMTSYPGAPVIQFDISGLNVTGDDVAVLVLKAASMQTQGDPVMVALMTIGSDWDESSDYTTFLVNILPAWNLVKKNDATAMSSNTDGDSIFAFDVSKKLLDARAEGGKISFLLEAISNSSSEIIFLSRESGEGPHLLVMPYPANSPEQVGPAKPQPDLQPEQQLKQLPVQATILSESINQTGEQAGAEVPATLQAAVAGTTIPVAGRMQSKQSMGDELELPARKAVS